MDGSVLAVAVRPMKEGLGVKLKARLLEGLGQGPQTSPVVDPGLALDARPVESPG